MTEPKVLDESAVSEIEAEIWQWRDFPKLQETVSALCATVKHLRNKTCPDCATVADDGSGYCGTCDDFTMPSDFSLRWVRRTELTDLQSQLEQLRAENEGLQQRVKQMAQDARDDADAASNEARWQERQGKDYGSY